MPPETETSESVKSMAGLSTTNAIVADWPARRAGVLEAIWTVGMTVSIEIGASVPPCPGLPAASVNEPSATVISRALRRHS